MFYFFFIFFYVLYFYSLVLFPYLATHCHRKTCSVGVSANSIERQAEKEEREALERAKKAEIEAREAKKREAAMGPQKKAKAKK